MHLKFMTENSKFFCFMNHFDVVRIFIMGWLIKVDWMEKHEN